MSVDPNPAPLDCSDVERLLDPWLDGEMAGKDAAEAAAHVERCAPCRAEATRRRTVRDGIRSSLRAAMGDDAVAAPEQLRLRIVEAIGRERPPLWRRILAPVPIAAAVACMLAVAVGVEIAKTTTPLVEEAVQRHARGLPLEITAADPSASAAVPEWFKGKLDFNPRPPRFTRPDIRLVGARLSHISDRPAAYMRYELPRGQAGLFIVEDHDGELVPSRVFPGDKHVRVVAAHGYNIAIWHQDGIAYSLVSDLDAAQLEALIESGAFEPR
jgi:anti-sigma factor RsiW